MNKYSKKHHHKNTKNAKLNLVLELRSQDVTHCCKTVLFCIKWKDLFFVPL